MNADTPIQYFDAGLGRTIRREDSRVSALEYDYPEWHSRRACADVDPEIFYPDPGCSPREAKQVCIGCDVRGECLQDALDNKDGWGVWGGFAGWERDLIRTGKRLDVSKSCPGCNKLIPAVAMWCSDACRVRTKRREQASV